MKKILILSSEKTGHGHSSSAEAIIQKLEEENYMVKEVDCFLMMNKIGKFMEDSYIPITTRHPFIYYLCHKSSDIFSNLLHSFIYLKVKKNLLKEINDFKPDLIISVHCMFTKSISYLLKRNNLNIPFYIVVIDLIKPPLTWQDKKADITFVPDQSIQQQYLKKGFSNDKLIVSGFPIRSNIQKPTKAKTIKDKLNVLMINPSVNLNKNIKFINEISRIKNVKINFICGLDERLFNTLSKMKEENKLPEQVEIFGFIKDVNQFLVDADLVICKAGPNMLYETIRSATAVIVSGHIKGQENNNYQFITNNNFGIKCEDPDQIYEVLSDFIESGKLQECLNNVFNYEVINGAETIKDYVTGQLN